MAPAASTLPPGAKVLNEGDLCDLLPGMCYPEGEGQMNLRNLHAVAIRGVLEESRLRVAVDALQARHPRMRAKYYEDPKTHMNYLLETAAKIPIHFREGAYETANLTLERELLQSIDFEEGPLCFISYIKHPDGTGLVVFGNTHAVSDGRGCEVALAQLLRLYDGQEVPMYHNVQSCFQIKVSENEARVTRGCCSCEEDSLVSPAKLQEFRQVQREHAKFQQHKGLRSGVVNSTFVDPPHPEFKAKFEGVVIELIRLTKDEQVDLLRACRAAGTTVTGAVIAAYQQAATRQLAAQGRGAETLAIGVDMNYRRYLEPRFGQEMGNFAFDVHAFVPVASPFWETAKGVMSFVAAVLEKNVGLEAQCVGMGGLSRERLLLMRRATPELMVGMWGATEHGNISSLGVLKNYGKYKEFEVLENITAAHIGFMGVKINVCTSAVSGVLTLSVMASKNIVENPRGVAKGIAADMRQLLASPPSFAAASDVLTGPAADDVAKGTDQAAALMQPLIHKNRERLAGAARGGDGVSFAGDSSGAHNTRTHLLVFFGAICSILAAGPLSGVPVYFEALQASGAFSGACAPGEYSCDGQKTLIGSLVSGCMSLMLTCAVFSGYVFDVMGAQRAGRFGALLASLSLVMLALALQLDGQQWPTLQFGLLFVFFPVADIGGLLASMGILGWMWHYPRHQGLIMGLSNLTYQASGPVIAHLFNALVDQGVPLSYCFLLAALLSAASGLGILLTVPTRQEYFKQAGRVLNVLPGSVDTASFVSWTAFKHHVVEVWHVMKLHWTQNMYFTVSMLFGCLVTIYRMSVLNQQYELWFGEREVHELLAFYATVQIVSSFMNVIAGSSIDRWGFQRFYLFSVMLLTLHALVCSLERVWAQQLSVCCTMMWFGCVQTLVFKWPAYFGPSELFGSFFGLIMSFVGLCCLLLAGAAMALQPTDRDHFTIPITIFAALSAVTGLACFAVLSREGSGIPQRPPRNRFG